MKRRDLLISIPVAALVCPLAAFAQQRTAKVQVGWLSIAPHPFLKPFREGLQELGYREGENLVIHERYADGKADRFPALIDELLGLRVQVIMASGVATVAAVHNKVRDLPVITVSTNPVDSGFVASMARPGANITGIALLYADISSKWPQLLKEVLPHLTRIVVLHEPTSQHRRQAESVRIAGRSEKIDIIAVEASSVSDIENAFELAKRERADAIVPLSSAIFAAHRDRIVALAKAHRLPAAYEHRDFVDHGGLMSYGHDLVAVFRRAAWYVDQVLKGRKPADLPIEGPTRIEFVINLGTAKALGITFPATILLRADDTIE